MRDVERYQILRELLVVIVRARGGDVAMALKDFPALSPPPPPPPELPTPVGISPIGEFLTSLPQIFRPRARL